MINQLKKQRQLIRNSNNLIHCITNPISINDCANAVLAVGCKPIMAEHPREVAEITKTAQALAVNLGNITDARLESIRISGNTALKHNIPCVIDLVGVACSKLRNDYAKQFIKVCRPNVIKGNISEIKAVFNSRTDCKGVDVDIKDEIDENNLIENAKILMEFSKKTGAIIIASGKIDMVCSGNKCYVVYNGNEMLSQITGTGCILNALTASFISSGDCFTGSLLAAVYLGIAGQLAYTDKGTGTFHVNLMDTLSTISDEQIEELINIKEVL